MDILGAEEDLVKLLAHIESWSPHSKRLLNIHVSNPFWCCLLFFRRPSQPANDPLNSI